MNRKIKKNVKFVGNIVIIETIVLTYLYLKFFLINYAILLWCNGCRELMSDAFRCAEFSEPAVFKLSAMVTPDSLDDTVFFSLKS